MAWADKADPIYASLCVQGYRRVGGGDDCGVAGQPQVERLGVQDDKSGASVLAN